MVVRGALNFGLKSFIRAMYSNGLIETSWGDSKVDGLGAMTGAWRCDEQATENECVLMDTDLMREIADYNEVDCRVMQQIHVVGLAELRCRQILREVEAEHADQARRPEKDREHAADLSLSETKRNFLHRQCPQLGANLRR